MDEIIDLPKKEKPKYLRKSALIYKISAGLVLFSIIVSVFIGPLLLKNYRGLGVLVDLAVGLPILSIFILSPMGLYYTWRSKRNNEGHKRLRLKYTLGHLFFCALIVIFIIVLVGDILMFLN